MLNYKLVGGIIINSFIVVDTNEKNLRLFNNNKLVMNTHVFIGRNGATEFKQEGDEKTPIGTFELGIVFGIHDKNKLTLHESLEYIKINHNLYWVDDIKSKHYNQLIDFTKTEKDWNSAEHLIDYHIQYEYAIEIKSNPQNMPGKGSAIFLHCSNGESTAGCIAIEREKMIELLRNIKEKTKIIIK